MCADPSQLEQVIVNLVVNARDAMPRGGRLTIRTQNVEIEPRNGRADPVRRPAPTRRWSWKIPARASSRRILGRIFEPFFTTKPFGRGTGLGLATVYGIVKQSRGDVQVHSTPARGTSFTVLLPAVDTSATASAETARDEGPDSTAGTRQRRNLLIVEDDTGVRTLTTQVLRDAGWTVLVAEDPAGALAIAASESQPIDLLLTDVVLPGINGSDLAQRLRTLRPGLPVLFMSGYAPEEIVASGALPTGGQLLRKPFMPAALRERVAYILKSAIEH